MPLGLLCSLLWITLVFILTLGRTALHCALRKARYDVTQKMLEVGQSSTPHLIHRRRRHYHHHHHRRRRHHHHHHHQSSFYILLGFLLVVLHVSSLLVSFYSYPAPSLSLLPPLHSTSAAAAAAASSASAPPSSSLMRVSCIGVQSITGVGQGVDFAPWRSPMTLKRKRVHGSSVTGHPLRTPPTGSKIDLRTRFR